MYLQLTTTTRQFVVDVGNLYCAAPCGEGQQQRSSAARMRMNRVQAGNRPGAFQKLGFDKEIY